jgi:hypothetical protein
MADKRPVAHSDAKVEGKGAQGLKGALGVKKQESATLTDEENLALDRKLAAEEG